MVKLVKLHKRHGGEILVNPEHIESIETYSYRYGNYNGHLSYFSSINFVSGLVVEVSEVSEYILELIKS